MDFTISSSSSLVINSSKTKSPGIEPVTAISATGISTLILDFSSEDYNGV
jgi:hypothetical protein